MHPILKLGRNQKEANMDEETGRPALPDAYTVLHQHKEHGTGCMFMYRSSHEANINAFGYGKPSGHHADVSDIASDIRSIGAHGRYKVSDELDFTYLLMWSSLTQSIVVEEIGENFPLNYPDLIVGRVLVPTHWSLQLYVEVLATIVHASGMLWLYDFCVEDNSFIGVSVCGIDELFLAEEDEIIPRLAKSEPEALQQNDYYSTLRSNSDN